jgi:hypothetical protein
MMSIPMTDEKAKAVDGILMGLPKGGKEIEQIAQRESETLNERILNSCCYRERLVTSFSDALREPTLERVDKEAWQRLAEFIPAAERGKIVYVVTDIYGYFRAPAFRVSELLQTTLWSHEIYIVGSDFDWLVGAKHDRLFLQGRAALSSS